MKKQECNQNIEVYYSPKLDRLAIYSKGQLFYDNDLTFGLAYWPRKLRRYGWYKVGQL